MKKRIYLASPFFTSAQIELRDMVRSIAMELGFDVFSPGHDNLMTDNSTQDELIRGFKRNVSEIENCDIMVAIGNDYDTGTMIEIGYAYAKKVPVIYFNSSNDGKRRNLMIAGISLMNATTYEQLAELLSLIDNQIEIIE